MTIPRTNLLPHLRPADRHMHLLPMTPPKEKDQ